MLNPLPILFLAPLGYFILRTGLAIILINLSLRHFGARKKIATSSSPQLQSIAPLVVFLLFSGEFIIGVLLFIGAYTQYAAIALCLMSIDLSLTRNIFSHQSIPQRSFYLLMLFAALSLIFTGGGAFAVDLPL